MKNCTYAEECTVHVRDRGRKSDEEQGGGEERKGHTVHLAPSRNSLFLLFLTYRIKNVSS